MKALIIRFSSAGDILLTNGVISVLKRKVPGVKVDLICKGQFAALAREAGADRVLEADFKRKGGINSIVDEINRENYDVIIDLQANLRSLYLRLFSNAGRKFVYKKDVIKRRLMVLFKWFLNDDKTVAEKYLDAVKPLLPGGKKGVNSSRIPHPASRIKKAVKKHVVIHVGAKWRNKRWPYFPALVDRLKKIKGLKITLTGVKDEVDNSRELLYIKSGNVRNLIGKTGLPGLSRVIMTAGLFIGNDTAAAHMARLHGVPSIIFLGPTVGSFGFVTRKDFIVCEKKGLFCRPCHLHGGHSCPIGTFECMAGISADNALAEVKKIL